MNQTFDFSWRISRSRSSSVPGASIERGMTSTSRRGYKVGMKRAVIASVMAGLIGCAAGRSGSGAGSAEDTFVVQLGGGGVLEAKLTQSELLGPDVQVKVSSSGLRGTAFNRPVDVSWKGDELTGLIGRAPVQLSVKREGEQIVAHGLYGGRLSNFRVSRQGMEGTIGSCGYSLKGSGTEYQGFRGCSQSVQSPTTVRIPPAFWEMPDAEKIALLGLMLGQ